MWSSHVVMLPMQKHKSGRNKGFGFTTFEAEKDLECVLQAWRSLFALCMPVLAVFLLREECLPTAVGVLLGNMYPKQPLPHMVVSYPTMRCVARLDPAPLKFCTPLQSAEHVIEGVMVKINRAGPRPEHEHPPDEKPQTAPSVAFPVRQLTQGIPLALTLPPANNHGPGESLSFSL